MKKEELFMNPSTAALAFDHLYIPYREHPFKDGTLYFCRMPNHGIVDLFVGVRGNLRLWCFVGNESPAYAGTRMEFQGQGQPSLTTGMEITEEGDLRLYMEQQCDDDTQMEESIRRMLAIFSRMLACLPPTAPEKK